MTRGRIGCGTLTGAAFVVLFVTSAVVCEAQPDVSRPNGDGQPTPVRVGLYLADLYDVSASDETFFADVLLQAEWVDPRLAGHATGVSGRPLDEIWNPRLQVVNQRSVTAFLPQRVEVDAGGCVRYRQRWVGRFSARMNLRDFPLDRQQLRVHVVSLGYPREEVALTVQPLVSGRAADFTLADWDVGATRMEIADYQAGPGATPLAGAQLRWEARRYVGYYAVQVILPLVLIVMMGWAAVWVDPAVVPARVSISMTAMLTLIAYRFSLGQSVPNLTYLTRFDYFMLASMLMVFTLLVIVAAGSFLISQGGAPTVRRLDAWTRRVFPIVFVVVFVLSWWK